MESYKTIYNIERIKLDLAVQMNQIYLADNCFENFLPQ